MTLEPSQRYPHHRYAYRPQVMHVYPSTQPLAPPPTRGRQSAKCPVPPPSARPWHSMDSEIVCFVCGQAPKSVTAETETPPFQMVLVLPWPLYFTKDLLSFPLPEQLHTPTPIPSSLLCRIGPELQQFGPLFQQKD